LRTPRRSLSRDLETIRKSLITMARAFGRLGPALASASGGGSSPAARTRRTLRLSPARRRALKLQGQYMGYLRSLKPREKARVKALRVAKGVRPAIALARKLAKP
jgi:hypothetical protein